MRVRNIVLPVKIALLLPGRAAAHASDQAFVLLLPTNVYSAAGVAAVVLTVLALFLVPAQAMRSLFQPVTLTAPPMRGLEAATSLTALAAMLFLITIGLNGPRDPLSNLMTLGFWTIWWVGLVILAGFAGDLWRWLNPWTGLWHVLGAGAPVWRLPGWLGTWPAAALLAAFYAFLLADIAPDDPARLAILVGSYWVITLAGLVLFGRGWLMRVEFVSVLFSLIGALATLRLTRRGGVGMPGWRLLEVKPATGTALFALVLLAGGSFDGINETFWWLAQIGINPLAFPGRSAVVWPTLIGLGLSIMALIGVFAATIWLGMVLAGERARFGTAFRLLALSLLPIAFGYHIAHYTTVVLVGGQYTIAALSDPWSSGADHLGIQPFYVTTGFFNHLDSVRLIWLTQAAAVVIGHVWAVLLAHRMALDLFEAPRRAVLATLPLSIFMIGYTFLGLWLLAAPRDA
ncbi:MAG: hypothetical protein AAGD47_06255 [Pseudomonadota bacterium]